MAVLMYGIGSRGIGLGPRRPENDPLGSFTAMRRVSSLLDMTGARREQRLGKLRPTSAAPPLKGCRRPQRRRE